MSMSNLSAGKLKGFFYISKIVSIKSKKCSVTVFTVVSIS